MPSKKRIFLCPLNWGLGHGTRDILLIRLLLDRGFEVIIGSSGRTLQLLKTEFPDLEFIHFQDYQIKYSAHLSAAFVVLLQSPAIFFRIVKEHLKLKKIISKKNISAVISDNRYGLFSSKVPSVFISHQMLIKPPKLFSFMEVWMWLFSAFFAQMYSFCWIPDVSSQINLSGDLSHKYPLPENGRFIGPLVENFAGVASADCDLLIMISGPEPGRSVFEKIILQQLEELKDLSVIVVLGKPEEKIKSRNRDSQKKHCIYSHLPRKEISLFMKKASLVISRPGYTTVMEVAHYGVRAAWVPTPGQTEQEYLSSHFRNMGNYYSIQQNKLELKKIWQLRNSIKPLRLKSPQPALFEAIDYLIERIDLS